jgi:DNA adenine methylase
MMANIPHPIPYQGSKRNLAQAIIAYFPEEAERLIEPFAGSAAIALAAAHRGKVQQYILNDLNAALIALWDEIINNPTRIADAYAALWLAQKGQERAFYDHIRTQFNTLQRPDYFLYLLARCVKASVRYNAKGEFNQSPDNRRKGAHPTTMRRHIIGASALLRGKTVLASTDYREIIAAALPSDIIYMDPPYQGVGRNRDPRYIGHLSFEDLVESLRALNERGVSYIVSYDGRTGSKQFGQLLPEFLGLTHIEIDAGRSSQATLLGRTSNTIESLYLSPALIARLGGLPEMAQQIPLFGISQ